MKSIRTPEGGSRLVLNVLCAAVFLQSLVFPHNPQDITEDLLSSWFILMCHQWKINILLEGHVFQAGDSPFKITLSEWIMFNNTVQTEGPLFAFED